MSPLAEALRAKLAEVEAERDALRAEVAEVKAQRDARTGGGIGFATSERVENGLPGVLGGPYCGKATGSIEFNHGAIGLTVKVVYPKTA